MRLAGIVDVVPSAAGIASERRYPVLPTFRHIVARANSAPPCRLRLVGIALGVLVTRNPALRRESVSHTPRKSSLPVQ
jgi:hypothetical protein